MYKNNFLAFWRLKMLQIIATDCAVSVVIGDRQGWLWYAHVIN